MSLKLKLKINPSKGSDNKEESPRPLPKFKIKPPRIKDEPSEGITKPKKEKLKKLKISLGKAALPLRSSASLPAPPKAPDAIPKRVPKVRIKPTRIPGEGYDSEAPDLEDDPLIEQGLVVRFANDANLDFVHNAVDTGDLSNVNIKWITRDKAVINVNLTLYSARLVDLPTLTELYKTIDKKNIFKTIDISQILLVLHPINPKQLNMEVDFEVPEDLTYTHPLYKLSTNKEIRSTRTVYKHGLAYAYEDVYRRLRPKKVNHRVMADIETRVDELIRRDNDAQESHYEYVDPKAAAHRYSGAHRHATPSMPTTPARQDSERTEAETEVEEEEDQMDLDLEADIDNVLEQELAEALDSTSNNTAATVLMKSEFDNEDGEGDGGAIEPEAEDDEEDDEDEEEEEEDEDDEDESVKEDKTRAKKLEEEIADLERAADKQKVLLATASYKMMRMKFQLAYNNLKGQLDLKKRELAKIREQHQKLQMKSKPNHGDKIEEDDDDDDEDDDDEDAADDGQELGQVEEQELGQVEEQGMEIDEDNKGPEERPEEAAGLNEEENDNEDFDDFQGLF